MPSVIILGASADRNKYGNKSLRAYQRRGYDVYPVNLRESVIEGERVYRSISEVPVRPETVTVYLPPEKLLPLLPDIAAKGCDELWLNPGAESDAVLAEARRLGLHVVQACSILGLGISPEKL